MKTASDYLDTANKTVTRISAEDAVKQAGNGVFIDVRDSSDIAKTGTIKNALRIPRGFIEFAACSSTPFYNDALKTDATIYLVCGAGGQAALAGQTLQEMGYSSVINIGGIGDWESAGGEMEK